MDHHQQQHQQQGGGLPGEVNGGGSGGYGGESGNGQELLFGSVAFSGAERDRIQKSLNMKLGADFISYRPGAGGSEIAYVQQWMVFDIANYTFGFNGWSRSIRAINIDYADKRGSKYEVGVSAIIRVTLKDGAFHEDIGYGNAIMPTRHQAMEKAKKQAVTDGTKRSLKMFGQVFGQCLNDKEYQRFIRPHAKKKRETADYSGNLLDASAMVSSSVATGTTHATQPPCAAAAEAAATVTIPSSSSSSSHLNTSSLLLPSSSSPAASSSPHVRSGPSSRPAQQQQQQQRQQSEGAAEVLRHHQNRQNLRQEFQQHLEQLHGSNGGPSTPASSSSTATSPQRCRPGAVGRSGPRPPASGNGGNSSNGSSSSNAPVARRQPQHGRQQHRASSNGSASKRPSHQARHTSSTSSTGRPSASSAEADCGPSKRAKGGSPAACNSSAPHNTHPQRQRTKQQGSASQTPAGHKGAHAPSRPPLRRNKSDHDDFDPADLEAMLVAAEASHQAGGGQ